MILTKREAKEIGVLLAWNSPKAAVILQGRGLGG